MTSWQATLIGTDTMEIVNSDTPQVKYVVKATRISREIKVFDNDAVIERVGVERVIHEFILEASENPGSSLRWAIGVTNGTISAHVVLNDQTIEVENAASLEGTRVLIRELKTRGGYPRVPYIMALVNELRNDRNFFDEVTHSTILGEPLIPTNGSGGVGTAFCVIVCSACAAEVTLACFSCFFLCLSG